MKTKSIGLLAMTTGLAMASCQAQADLVQNGDFSNGYTDWSRSWGANGELISQNINTVTGETYDLSFQYILGNDNSGINISIGGNLIFASTAGGTGGSFIPSGNIPFTATGSADTLDILVNNFQVTDGITDISVVPADNLALAPEPSTYGVYGVFAGMGLLALVRSRPVVRPTA